MRRVSRRKPGCGFCFAAAMRLTCAWRALSAHILVGDSMLACRAFAALVLLAGGAARRAAAFVLERVLLAWAVFGTIGTAFLWR